MDLNERFDQQIPFIYEGDGEHPGSCSLCGVPTKYSLEVGCVCVSVCRDCLIQVSWVVHEAFSEEGEPQPEGCDDDSVWEEYDEDDFA